MKTSFQIDDFRLLDEALKSNSDSIRLGSEFCEYLLPEQDVLKESYDIVHGAGKEFIYVTPRLSNDGIEKVKKHFAFLNEKDNIGIVFNDLGTLNFLGNFQNLRPRLGRLLIRVPARSPFAERMAQEGFTQTRKNGSGIHITRGNSLAKKWYEELFSYTSLDYSPTIEFFKSYGVRDADVDWIPRTFDRFDSLIKQGLNLSVHLNLLPVAVSRKCHTARFLGEESPDECSKPCLKDVFMLRSKLIGVEFLLQGNAAFTFAKPSEKYLEKLRALNVAELVYSV
jgi:hypothetical protein